MALNRSFLFAPGNHPRRVEKAFTLGADAVILDLEDAVALTEKAASRNLVAEAVARAGKVRVYVRVNAMGTPFCFRDLADTVVPGLHGVVLPKVESAADLHAIDWMLWNLELERGMAPGSLDLIPLEETAAGLSRVDRVFQARSLKPYSGRWRVRRAAFGAADYANELGMTTSADERELDHARARLVLAAASAGVEPPLDSPYFDIKDAEGYRRSTERSRRMGFQGRLCIHPDQVAGANAGFAPSADEVARARRIVDAFREAEAKGAAAVQVDGKMVDYPVVRQAQRLLDLLESVQGTPPA
jgi:citrate lyase subunit beta/citryl-CoA lyase